MADWTGRRINAIAIAIAFGAAALFTAPFLVSPGSKHLLYPT
jgi:hypothetical protein